ncbi:MAG: hypothetical protein IIA88_07530 [Bacteroidetes bacterium]|nr:hypothetical protein [Bacteroidota bacterium]
MAFAGTGIHIKKSQKSANLLILPASLVDNWREEIKKFLPSLTYYIAHPSLRQKSTTRIDENNLNEINSYDLVITTYALAGRYEWLKEYGWNYIILDEAQAIKNPGTSQTKHIKQINPGYEIYHFSSSFILTFKSLFKLGFSILKFETRIAVRYTFSPQP